MKIEVHVQAYWNKYNKEIDYSISSTADMAAYGYALVKTVEIEFESMADKELKGRIVQALRAQKTRIYADAEANARDIDSALDQLLALEHKPEVSE